MNLVKVDLGMIFSGIKKKKPENESALTASILWKSIRYLHPSFTEEIRLLFGVQ